MIVDVAVVGAGAAGLVAAIMAQRSAPDKKILLLDTRQKIGAKILISGGTRCNVTNRQVTPSDYQGGPRHFIQHVLEAFTPAQTIDFFSELGVELVLEPTGKYFPTTHSGKTVLEALLKEVNRLGILLKTGIRIDTIKKEGELFVLEGEGEKFSATSVILATGGLSYPLTGSDGGGLKIAKNFGHKIISTYAALTPLVSQDEKWKSLSGVTLEAELSFFRASKKEVSSRGSFLFTHFGFSGPAALDISRHFSSCPYTEKPEIFANFIPTQTDVSLKELFDQRKGSNKTLKYTLIDQLALPTRFVEVFMEKNELDPTAVFRTLSKAHQRKLIQLLRQAPLEVTGIAGYAKAEVTAGGVDLKEVKFSTMESRLVPRLYFTGEILDVDGRIGGFNFQWAWSSGAVAGRSAAKAL